VKVVEEPFPITPLTKLARAAVYKDIQATLIGSKLKLAKATQIFSYSMFKR
jgi:hypothetical protein